MKKMFAVTMLLVAALGIFATSTAFAQTPQPANPTTGSSDGPLHTYMVNALAQALGITPADFEARRDTGKTAYQIALDLGFAADQIPALLSKARAQALDAAVADKVITQQQADWMKSHGSGMGMGTGTCTGSGLGAGAGGMMGRGGRWQQSNP